MTKKNKKVYKVGNRYVIKENGKVKIVTKKSETINKNMPDYNLKDNKEAKAVTKSGNITEDNPVTINNPALVPEPKGFKFKDKKVITLIAIITVFVILAISLPLALTYVKAPDGLRLNGDFLCWNEVDDTKYYVVDVNGLEYTTENNSLDVSGFTPNSYKAKVRTIKNETLKSKYSEVFNFEIAKPELQVYGNDNIIITKTYDGRDDYNNEIKLGVHYFLNEAILKYGKNVDITVTDARYNSPDVNTANSIEVFYSAKLEGENAEYYQIIEGSFKLKAKILPKYISIIPSNFVKQFADEDYLVEEILDEEAKQKVEVSYSREPGEKIGFYDVTGVSSLNANYIINFDPSDGENKFEIIQRVVNVKGADGVILNKIYDGNANFPLGQIVHDLYTIENIVVGYKVEIIITHAVFNSANVEDANTVTVYFDEKLVDSNGVYKSLKSHFEIAGKIAPKPIQIVPNKFSKEFGFKDELLQDYYDSELNQNIELTFLRTEGEAIGTYDLVDAYSSSKNYRFYLMEDSGRNKFEIEKRTISILATGEPIKKVYDGNVIYSGEIIKGVHYILDGTIQGFDVDINVVSSYFNSAGVTDTTHLTVELDGDLYDPNGIYRVKIKSFTMPALINIKHIQIVPDFYTKQYGDADNLSATYYDGEINEAVSLVYKRTYGETVGTYDVISAVSKSSNYEFTVINASDKFVITKRLITVSDTGILLSKTFDNTDICDLPVEKGVHYKFNNIVDGEEPSIEFSKKFNAADVSADGVILSISALTEYSDRYILVNDTVKISALITPKLITAEPLYYVVQYGDIEHMRETYTDEDLNITFDVTFVKEEGVQVGEYDIVSAIADNRNYSVTVINGEAKYQIAPRILGVEKVGNPTFNKVYDGTTSCVLPITQGLHYNLTNLNGGSNVTLNIVSKEYNSKNVAEATKLIVRFNAILDGADAGQFVTVGGTMEFDAKISPRALTVAPKEFNKDYLSEFELIQKVEDPVSGDIVPVTFGTSAGEDHRLTECGTYDITSVSWTDANHTFTLAEGSGKNKFIINRIYLTINATNRNTVYNAGEHAILTPSSEPARELRVVYKPTSAEDSAFGTELPVMADTYTARIIFDGDRNYLPTYVDRSLIIERADSIITNTTPTDYIYDGKIKPLTATLNHSEAELVFSRNNYVNAGTYNYIMISVPQTRNYKATSIIVSLTIAKCVMNNDDLIYPTASEIVYGQHLYSAFLTGGSNLGKFEWIDPTVLPVVADKQFLVTFTPDDFENYDWTNVDLQRYVDVTVNQFVLTELVYPTATAVVYTNKLSTSKLIGTSEYGSFEWQDATITPSGSGYYAVVFTPYDEENYDFSLINKIQDVYVNVSFRTYFQTNGGSEIESMIVKEIVSEPFTYREGYAFDGWFLDESLTIKATFPLQINRDTILYAAWYSEGLIFLLRDGYYSVKLDASTVESEIFIPTEYKGLPVKSIESEGFRNCTALELIVIPESVVSIGHYAFVGCVNLAFVQIINGIENIDFGIDWIESGYIYGTDVFFNAEHCPNCDGTKDFHQPNCECYTDNI